MQYSIVREGSMGERFKKKRREILVKVSCGRLTPEEAEEALMLLEEEQLSSNGETAYVEMRREMRSMERKTDDAKKRMDQTLEYMATVEERMEGYQKWMGDASEKMENAQEAVSYAMDKLASAGAEHSSKTTYEIVEDGCNGTAEYQLDKSGGGINKIKLPASFLSAYGGPVEGDVHVARTDGPGILIYMCGYFKANEKKKGKSFIDKMLPTVSIEDGVAIVAHPLANLKTLPDGIELVFLEIFINASEEVKMEFGARKKS